MTVGAENKSKTWYLPKKVLTHCSPFFDAALNGNCVEASSRTVHLPEDNPVAFEHWATWLSLGKYENLSECIDECDYVRAWNLGDKFACPAFKDHMMFQLVNWFENVANLWDGPARLAYEISSPGSKLRRYFVDLFLNDKLHGRLADDADELISIFKELPEFLEDVVKREVKLGYRYSPLGEKHRYYENPAFKPGT